MTRWKKDAKEFTVSVVHLEHRNIVNIPKPVIEYLGDPDNVTFCIKKNGIVRLSNNLT